MPSSSVFMPAIDFLNAMQTPSQRLLTQINFFVSNIIHSNSQTYKIRYATRPK